MGHIIWLASYPLSGDLWLRVFLNRLVRGPSFAAGEQSLDEITPHESLAEFYQPFFSCPISEVSEEELAQKRPQVHRAIAGRAKGFIFLKTNAALMTHLGTSTITFDVTAGAIYLMRNPLDIAVWFSRVMAVSIDTAIEIMNVKGRMAPRDNRGYELIGSWSENVDSWTQRPHDRLHVLRYEDMIDDPIKEFNNITRFLQINVSDQEIESAVNFSIIDLFEAANAMNELDGESKSAIHILRSGTVDQWKGRLTTNQISAILRENNHLMEKFGYWGGV